MPVILGMADALTRRLPKVVSPRGHALADYATIAVFGIAAAVLWNSNRRAAHAALLCAGAELAVNLLTNYPGGAAKMIPFRTHGRIDLGLAAMAATMPEFLRFREHRGFFLAQSGAITATANLTDFRPARPPR